MTGLSIAILGHSTNPRGGVVHALELADALTDLGHHAAVHAADPRGAGFFRATRCRTVGVPARAVSGGLAELVETRIEDYLAFFDRPGARHHDVYHAQDGISGNALATLRERGRIPAYALTVHHLDHQADPRVAARQARALRNADRVFCVSRMWQDALARDHGIKATLVGNGVDTARFSPVAGAADEALRARLGLGDHPVFLAIGGVEERKNSVRILQAFIDVRRTVPDARLIVAGGASLLDHSAARAAFNALALQAELGDAVTLTGPLADAEMPALYRLADALVFPSLREGFGLVVLEAMASGTPVIVPAIAPFTEYLGAGDALWADPFDPGSIAAAMRAALEPDTRPPLIAAGHGVARRFGWDTCARAHLATYARLAAVGAREPAPCPK